jgi:glucose/arabinose dehydrogenase
MPIPAPRPRQHRRLLSSVLLSSAVLSLGCGSGEGRKSAGSDAPPCPSSELTLPDGFCATVFADTIGHARHLAVGSNGTVYVNTWSGEYYGNDTSPAGGFLVALRDTTGDGRADVLARFGDSVPSGGTGGTGIAIYRGALYAEAKDKILRYALEGGSIAPTGPPEVVVDRLPITGDHPHHNLAIDSSGRLFLNSGSASNACQIKNRIAGSP